MMKILFIIDSLGSGGAQRQKAYLARNFAAQGHKVEIFIYAPSNDFYLDEFISAGIKVHQSQFYKAGFSPQIIFELRKIICQGFDCIISSLHAPSIYAAIARLGITQGKLIVCEESSSYAPVSFARRLLFYFACLVSDTVVTNSVHETRLKSKNLGLKSKTQTIWNGYDLSTHSTKKLNSGNSQKILLIVGRVAYPKNGLNLLKGLARFHEKNKWLPRIYWAGRNDTDKRSIKMQEEMNTFLSENKDLQNHWSWLGEVKDINALYQSCDAMIHPSIYEGLPNVICEAMLNHCFVIASNVCDHPLLIGDNERGLLFDPLLPESICNALENFYDIEDEMKLKITYEANTFARKNFDQTLMAGSFLRLMG
jgi:glycosyltransferase involved in cell wall biosynthesis